MGISEDKIATVALGIIQRKRIITTTELIGEIEQLMNPSGTDNDILSGRNDSKFSQRVRNLVSHRNPVLFNNPNIQVNQDLGMTTFTWIGQ